MKDTKAPPTIDGLDHLFLVRVALAGTEFLDRLNGNALVRDFVLLAPCGQDGEETAIHMGRDGAQVTMNFFVIHCRQTTGLLVYLLKPSSEPNELHPSTFVTTGLELYHTRLEHIVEGQRPSGMGAEIEGQTILHGRTST